MNTPMRRLAILLGAGALLALAGRSFEWLSEARDRKRYPHPGRLFPVRSRRLHLHCTGDRRPDQPVVVLEAGLGSSSFDWRLVQPAVAEWARVCSYDRAGYGWSDADHAARTPRQTAADLRQLLTQAGEQGPYVLVGHSYGGILVREFARQCPGDVAGMVLVDSAHENQLSRLSAEELKQIRASLPFFQALVFLARLGLVRLLARRLVLRSFPSTRSPEEQDILLTLVSRPAYFEALGAEIRAVAHLCAGDPAPLSLADVPLVVIQAAGRPPVLPRGYTEERWQQTRRMFDDIQRELSGLSSNSRLVRAEHSVHAVQLEQPDILIDAVRRVVFPGREGVSP